MDAFSDALYFTAAALAARAFCAARATSASASTQRETPSRAVAPYTGPSKSAILADRNAVLGFNMEVNYSKAPLLIVRGRGAYLYDENDNEYLDVRATAASRNLGCARALTPPPHPLPPCPLTTRARSPPSA